MVTKSSITCPICGTLCDDLELTIQDNKVVAVKKACAVGEAKFLNYYKDRPKGPLIRKEGKLTETTWDEAIKRSAEILVKASYPIFYGWSSTSCEAIKTGLELTEEVGGVNDNTSTVCHGPSVLGIQDIGMSSCTLGQIRHRADLVIYWGSNPWSAHPRHTERYTMFTDGRFQDSTWKRYAAHSGITQLRKRYQRLLDVTRGYQMPETKQMANLSLSTLPPQGRKMVVVDTRRTRSADVADYFLQVHPNSDYEILQALRMLVKGEELDLDEVAGISVELLEEVANVLINCELGIIFFGLGLTMSQGKHRNIDAALSLVRDLNNRTKFLIMPMRGHFNVTGTNVVSLWQTGYPFAIDFSRGYPQYNPGETSVVDILSRDESDAGLVIASDPVSNFPASAVQNLIKHPLIVIDPLETPTSLLADVVLPSTFVGIETEGTAYRMDHVPLPLKKVVAPPPSLLSDEEILSRILAQVKKLKAETKP
ncbi:MAG: molybdopterin-dependent oxidoreductase [Candidatus Bathyarchaeota archaeon]